MDSSGSCAKDETSGMSDSATLPPSSAPPGLSSYLPIPNTRGQQWSRSNNFVVTVNLTTKDSESDLVVPVRQVILTRDSPSIRVGRASKQESKGFVAGPKNAWFDSPVMSREHAQLSANFDSKVRFLPLPLRIPQQLFPVDRH